MLVISDEELAALEQRLGVKLPASYIEFVSTSQNGGLLKRNGFPIHNASGNAIRTYRYAQTARL